MKYQSHSAPVVIHTPPPHAPCVLCGSDVVEETKVYLRKGKRVVGWQLVKRQSHSTPVDIHTTHAHCVLCSSDAAEETAGSG